MLRYTMVLGLVAFVGYRQAEAKEAYGQQRDTQELVGIAKGSTLQWVGTLQQALASDPQQPMVTLRANGIPLMEILFQPSNQ